MRDLAVHDLDEARRSLDKVLPFIVLLVLFFLCYIYAVANFNLTVDSEYFAFDRPDWLGNGRWALQWLTDFLWPKPVTPAGPHILFGLLGSAAYLVTLRAFGITTPRLIDYVLFPLYIAFPVWFAQTEFPANVIGDGLALLLCALAALQSRTCIAGRPEPLEIAVIVQLLTMAAGIYQSTCLIWVALAFALDLTALAEDRIRWKRYGANAATILLVVMLALGESTLIGKLVLWLQNRDLSAYATSFLRLDLLAAHPWQVLRTTLGQAAALYAGYWRPFGMAAWVFAAVMLFLPALLLLQAPRTPVLAAAGLLACAAIAASPILLDPVMGGVLPLRVCMAAAAASWLFLFLPTRLLSSRWSRWGAMLLGVLAFTQILYIQSMIQARSWMVQQHDRLLAGQLHARIDEVRPADGKAVKVRFFGRIHPDWPYPALESTVSGSSFFEWDGGNPYRMTSFMRVLGYDDLTVTAPDDCERLTPEFAGMPVWPARGAVRAAGDIVLVKLSDQERWSCRQGG